MSDDEIRQLRFDLYLKTEIVASLTKGCNRLEGERNALQAEVERLREQLTHYPKTRDGAPLYPEMRVFFESMDPKTATVGRVVSSVEFYEDEGQLEFDAFTEDVRDPNGGGPLVLPDDFGLYSSREALEAAEKESPVEQDRD